MNMSKADLMKALDLSSVHTLYDTLADDISKSVIVKLFTIGGECVKIKGDKHISVINITPDFITVQFDSHKTDYMYSAIEKIEYYQGGNLW